MGSDMEGKQVVTSEPPPAYDAGSIMNQAQTPTLGGGTATTFSSPPSYQDSVDPKQYPPITATYEKPVLPEGMQWGSYIPEGQAIIVVPQLIGNEWRWVPQTFTNAHEAKVEAIARLNRVQEFRVIEMIQWLQTITSDCIVEPNTYVVHDGVSGVPLFVAKEQSDGCTRCCMAPHHTYQIKLFLADQYGYPQYGIGPVYTIDRDGADCQGCGKCTPLPCCPCAWRKCLGCYNCAECSRNEMILYEGDAPGYPKEQKPNVVLGRAQEGRCCSEGWCMRPSISLYKGASPDPYAIAEGPTFFGGFLNCCVQSLVPVSYIQDLGRHRQSCKGALDVGDVAMIRKEIPDSCCGMLQECCTDADKYHIQVNDVTASIETRVSLMASIFMIDSMLFEQDPKVVEDKGSHIEITFCEYYCCGAVLPCCLAIPKNK